MRRDKRAPALYELMRPRSKSPPLAGSVPAPYTRAPVASPETDDSLSWLSPGRVIRIPVGYVFVAAVVLVAMMIGGYMAGYKQRQREEERQRALEVRRQLDGVTDPLAAAPAMVPAGPAASPGGGGGTGAPIAGRPEPASPTGAPGAAQVQAGSSGGRLIVVRDGASDPRVVGQNYLVVAMLAYEEAERAANFLASRGLEILLVPVHNRPSNWHVIVGRGFGSGEYYGPSGKRLEHDIHALGREYKSQHRGPVNFSDAWWLKHR